MIGCLDPSFAGVAGWNPFYFGSALVWYMDARYEIYSDAGTTPANVGDLIYQQADLATGDIYSQATSGDRPTLRVGANGKRYVDFTGGKVLVCASPTNKPLGNSDRSFAIGLNNTADTGDHWPFSYGSPTDNNTFSMIATNGLRIIGFNNDWSSGLGIGSGAWHRVDSTFDGATIDLRKDAGTPDTHSTTYDSDAGIGYFGGFSFVLSTLYYTGFISQFFMTNTTWTSRDRANADAFLLAQEPN